MENQVFYILSDEGEIINGGPWTAEQIEHFHKNKDGSRKEDLSIKNPDGSIRKKCWVKNTADALAFAKKRIDDFELEAVLKSRHLAEVAGKFQIGDPTAFSAIDVHQAYLNWKHSVDCYNTALETLETIASLSAYMESIRKKALDNL